MTEKLRGHFCLCPGLVCRNLVGYFSKLFPLSDDMWGCDVLVSGRYVLPRVGVGDSDLGVLAVDVLDVEARYLLGLNVI